MLLGKKDSIDAQTFWQNREEELGCPVLVKKLGRVVQIGNARSLWGLIYTTEKAVYFQTFKSENWMSLLFSGGKGGQTHDKTIEIPREQVKSFAVKVSNGRRFRFFVQPPQVELVWQSDGGEEALLLEIDNNPQELVDSFYNTSGD